MSTPATALTLTLPAPAAELEVHAAFEKFCHDNPERLLQLLHLGANGSRLKAQLLPLQEVEHEHVYKGHGRKVDFRLVFANDKVAIAEIESFPYSTEDFGPTHREKTFGPYTDIEIEVLKSDLLVRIVVAWQFKAKTFDEIERHARVSGIPIAMLQAYATPAGIEFRRARRGSEPIEEQEERVAPCSVMNLPSPVRKVGGLPVTPEIVYVKLCDLAALKAKSKGWLLAAQKASEKGLGTPAPIIVVDPFARVGELFHVLGTNLPGVVLMLRDVHRDEPEPTSSRTELNHFGLNLPSGQFYESNVSLDDMYADIKKQFPDSTVVTVMNQPWSDQEDHIETAMRYSDEIVCLAQTNFFTKSKGPGADGARRLRQAKFATIDVWPTGEFFPDEAANVPQSCFLHWQKNDQTEETHWIDRGTGEDCMRKRLDLQKFDVIVRPQMTSIIEKVLAWRSRPTNNDSWEVFHHAGSHVRRPDGVQAEVSGTEPWPNLPGTIPMAASFDRMLFVSASSVKSQSVLDRVRFGIPNGPVCGHDKKAIAKGTPVKVFTCILPLPTGVACSGTYLAVSPTKTRIRDEDTLNAQNYLTLLLPRLLMWARMGTMERDAFTWVPVVDFTRSWTDDQLFDEIGLTEAERKYVRETIRPW